MAKKKDKSSPAAKAPEVVKSVQIVDKLKAVLEESKSAGYVIAVADAEGSISTFAGARSHGDLLLINHVGQKEVDRIMAAVTAPPAAQ